MGPLVPPTPRRCTAATGARWWACTCAATWRAAPSSCGTRAAWTPWWGRCERGERGAIRYVLQPKPGFRVVCAKTQNPKNYVMISSAFAPAALYSRVLSPCCLVRELRGPKQPAGRFGYGLARLAKKSGWDAYRLWCVFLFNHVGVTYDGQRRRRGGGGGEEKLEEDGGGGGGGGWWWWCWRWRWRRRRGVAGPELGRRHDQRPQRVSVCVAGRGMRPVPALTLARPNTQ
jgi:hypothetical protein